MRQSLVSFDGDSVYLLGLILRLMFINIIKKDEKHEKPEN